MASATAGLSKKTHMRGWTYAMTPAGTLTVTTPTGITRTSRPPRVRHAASARSRSPGTGDPPDLPLTTPRVLATRPGRLPEPGADPHDDPPPFLIGHGGRARQVSGPVRPE